MLKLYQFPAPKGFPNFSPYCVKVETYLKMTNTPYENVFTLNLSKSPKKLMPYIELDGEIISDSSFIIEKLVKLHGNILEEWLTPQQQALSIVLQRLLENHLLPIMMYFRWTYPGGWSQFREIIFHKAPTLVKIFFGWRISRKITKRLQNGHAVSNFSVDELLDRAKKDLEALSTLLGDQQFILGDKASTIDGLMLGVIGGIACVPVETPLKTLACQYQNLTQHSMRLLNTYYSGK
ncbi:MAG: glutathione S-transferase family protein [Burkholderiales bacterium]|nr:glutathione S-transferase family protein [Burkholderiales bacterium]